MRRAADPNFIDPDLGNVREFIRIRNGGVDDEYGDENYYQDDAVLQPSSSEIERALNP